MINGMYRNWRRIVLLAMVAVWGYAAPTSRPTTEPAAAERAEHIRRWVIGLMDVDPAVRERSLDELLGMGRDDLPLLKLVLAKLPPLDPEVRQELPGIIEHVYLSEEPFEPARKAFLGVRMPREEIGREHDPKVEIVIESRLPGFDAYRKLRNGDGILDLEESPLPQPPDRNDFIERVKEMRPGRVIHLKVLREGKVISVGVRLGRRPAEINEMAPGTADQFSNDRAAKAQKYIKEEFGQILGESKPQ